MSEEYKSSKDGIINNYKTMWETLRDNYIDTSQTDMEEVNKRYNMDLEYLERNLK